MRFKRFKYNPLKSDQRGVALLLAMTSLILLVFIASEVTKDSTIEYVVNSQELNRLKAYYAARNGMDVALLRIKIYQQVSGMGLPGGLAQEIDQIWKFPFSWPLPVMDTMSSSDRESSDEKSKDALFTGQYDQIITDEGSKIDINDLNSPSEVLRSAASKQLINIFEQQLETNDAFRDRYQNFNFTELVNRISDWMTDTQDNQSKNGGDKRAAFQDLPKEDYPPNRGFRTVDELRLVPGMNDELFDMISNQITIYGMKSINPNIATEKVLKSIDKGMTDEAVKAAVERRNDPDKGGPFKGAESKQCRDDFKGLVESNGARMSADFEKIPFSCDKVVNFRIQVTGRSGAGKGAVQKKIIAVVMDISKIGATIKTFVDEEKKAAGGTAAAGGGAAGGAAAGSKPSAPAKEPLPKGRPRIVYWSEL